MHHTNPIPRMSTKVTLKSSMMTRFLLLINNNGLNNNNLCNLLCQCEHQVCHHNRPLQSHPLVSLVLNLLDHLYYCLGAVNKNAALLSIQEIYMKSAVNLLNRSWRSSRS